MVNKLPSELRVIARSSRFEAPEDGFAVEVGLIDVEVASEGIRQARELDQHGEIGLGFVSESRGDGGRGWDGGVSVPLAL